MTDLDLDVSIKKIRYLEPIIWFEGDYPYVLHCARDTEWRAAESFVGNGVQHRDDSEERKNLRPPVADTYQSGINIHKAKCQRKASTQ